MVSNGDEHKLSNGCRLYRANRKIVEDYWTWICSLPKPGNPFLNNDGSKDEEQNDKRGDNMFYLSPADSGRSHRFCKVPSGHKILIPSLCVVATGHGTGGERPRATLDQLKRFNAVDQDQNNIEYRRVKIDGELIPEKFLMGCKYEHSDKDFEVNFPPKDPMFNAEPGTCQAVADGVYLICELPPVSDENGKASKHTIHLEGKINIPDKGDSSLETTNYTEDVFYTLAQKAK
jgi:hypothetical protein